MPPNALAVHGKEQIRATLQGFFRRVSEGNDTVDMTINTEEIRVTGDWAFARGTFLFTMTPTGEGETSEMDGKWLSILERQADGSWKIARDCYNENTLVRSD